MHRTPVELDYLWYDLNFLSKAIGNWKYSCGTIIVMKKIFILLFIFSTLFLSITQSADAQTNGILPSDANIELSPEIPGANQYVTATASSFSTDLNAATISWIVNGKTKSSSKGLKTFSFTTGPSNTTTSLVVNIVTKSGEIIRKTFTLKPSSVDLLWQSYGYTPPFYKGKTLFSHQNKIKFIALPHIIGSNGAEIPAGNLIYKWTRNGTVLGDFSGYGKNTYTMISSVISRPLQIQVEVTSPTSDDIAEASVVAAPIEPTVTFYEKNPLYGIRFQKALVGDITMTGTKEIDVLVAPFYFGVSSLTDYSLNYKWNINNTPINDGEIKIDRVFRQKEGTVGTSYISLTVENTNKILQYATGGFNLKFDNAVEQNTL